MAKNKKKNSVRSGAKAVRGVGGVLRNTCCIFTVLLFIIYCVNSLVSGSFRFQTDLGITAGIFAISLIASLATLTYDVGKIPFWLSHLIVFVIVGLVYYVLVIRIPNISEPNQKLVAFTLYAFAFIIYTVVLLIVRGIKKKKQNKEKNAEYKSKF